MVTGEFVPQYGGFVPGTQKHVGTELIMTQGLSFRHGLTGHMAYITVVVCVVVVDVVVVGPVARMQFGPGVPTGQKHSRTPFTMRHGKPLHRYIGQ